MRRTATLAVFVVLSVACSPAASDTTTTTLDAPAPAEPATTTLVPPATETPTPMSSSTTSSSTTTRPPLPTATLDVHTIWAFPGPLHYEGDVLTLQLPIGDFAEHELSEARVIVDGSPIDAGGILSGDPLLGGYVIFPDAIDTSDQAGTHVVEVEAVLDGEPISASTDLTVAPADERPDQETRATWETVATACCDIQYLSDSAAARDIDELVTLIDASAASIVDRFGVELPRTDLVLIDVLWGNGGYAGHELVVSYLDRDFGPRTDDTIGVTFMHEFTHAITREFETTDVPWPLEEAVAVFATGGHFKQESLPARAKALSELGGLLPLREFLDDFAVLQHESRYVEAGALATYLVDTYGWDAFLEFFAADVQARTSSRWFDRAARAAFGVGIDSIDESFTAWVASQEAGDELPDLELTIALQEARRAYQVNHAPYQNYFVYPSVTEMEQPATALRESNDAANVAAETLIGWGQQLIIEGRYEEARHIIDQVEVIAATGRIDGGIAAEFLEVAQLLAADGLELLDLDLTSDGAVVTATRRHPDLVDLLIDPMGGVELLSAQPATTPY